MEDSRYLDSDFNNSLLINRYKFLKYLQKGSYGKVFKVIDLKTSKFYSIKSIPIKYEQIANHEIKTLMKLQGNVNICQLISHFKLANSIYLVLEYCNGGDLHDYIKYNQFNSTSLYKVAIQLYNAINFSHSKGIYHRDLKPENILLVELNSLNCIKLCDWGLSTNQRLSNEFNVGTEKYMAPEVFISNYQSSFLDLNFKVYDSKYVDYWSFGITMMTILFGKTPFKTINNRSLIQDLNYKRFVLSNEKNILFEIYPTLNQRGFNLFENLFRISGVDDNDLTQFQKVIRSRNLDQFINDFKRVYRYGLTVDDEIDTTYNNYKQISKDLLKYKPCKESKKIDYSLRITKHATTVEKEILLDDYTNLNWFDY